MYAFLRMATLNDAPQLLNVSEIADRLRLTQGYVRELLRSGELPGVRLGRVWRIDAKKLAQWVEEKSSQKE
jgi:excisionase family DNA binding protein